MRKYQIYEHGLHLGSDNYALDEIVLGMAAALHVNSWANCESEAGRSLMQVNEMEAAPPITREAEAAAWRLAGKYEQANYNLPSLCAAAARADGDEDRYNNIEYQRDFGHYLAMMALGAGPSWFDDHAEFELTRVNFEFHYFSPSEYGGEDTDEKDDATVNTSEEVDVIAIRDGDMPTGGPRYRIIMGPSDLVGTHWAGMVYVKRGVFTCVRSDQYIYHKCEEETEDGE